MAGQITNYGSQLFLKTLFGRGSDVPTTLYIALCIDNEPTVMATGSDLDEPTTESYQRAALQNVENNWILSGTESISNATPAEFPIANEDWGPLRFFAVCTTPTGGKVIGYGELASFQEVFQGDQVIIAIGGISFTLFNAAYEGD